jgi:hypothetical protein
MFLILVAKREVPTNWDPEQFDPHYLAASQLFMFCTILRVMKSDREIEILFRRLRLYDQFGRRAEGLVRTIQRAMKERYANARTIEMARREGGGQLALDRRARRATPARRA